MTASKAAFAASRSTRLEAIGREVHDVAVGGQQANEQPTQARVVFDDEQVHRAECGAGS